MREKQRGSGMVENSYIYLAKKLKEEKHDGEIKSLADFLKLEERAYIQTMTHAEILFNEMKEIGHDIKEAYHTLIQKGN